MMSSSYSSDGFPTAVQEEDEEDLLEDCSSELGIEQEHSSMAGSPMVLSGSQLQQQQHIQRPSRLGVMTAASGGMELPGGQQQGEQLPGAGKVLSADLDSVASACTNLNLSTAVSLGRRGADGDLLFDLDDDSGSSAAHTPMGSDGRSLRGGSPLGQRLPAAAGGAAPGAAAAAAAADADVVMSAAGSLRQAEGMFQYASSAVQMQSRLASAFSGAAAVADGAGNDGAAAAATPARSNSGGSSSLCSPMDHALSTPVSDPVNVARSVQASGTGGWMFREVGAKGGLGTVGRLNSKKNAVGPRRRTGVHRTMYPPPVIRAPPRATNEVLSGLSAQQWQAFMQELLAYMDDALRPGRGAWRGASQAAGLGNVAMSCPRF
jgi:hypothetical protein